MKLSHILNFIFAGCCVVSISTNAQQINNFKLEVDQPQFIIPQFSGPYREREAPIAPEEYEMADRLRGLLDKGDKQVVLKELEAFYEIELSIAMLMLKAQVYFALEEYDKAVQTYLVSLSRSPQLVRAHIDLGQLYMLQNKTNKAREYFARAVELGAKEAEVYGQLGYLNLTQYGPFSAITAYQQALAIEPDNKQWQQGLFISLTQAKMFDAAQALLTDLITKEPDNSQFWLDQAVLQLEQSRNAEALASLEMAILLGDKRVNNLKIAAQLHLQRDSFPRAVELIKAHINTETLDLKSLHAYLSWLNQREMWSDVEDVLLELTKNTNEYNNAKQSVIYLYTAELKRNQNQPKLAKTHYKNAINKDPNNGHALLSYANFLVTEKSFIEAETFYLRAEALEKTQRHAMLGRAQMYVDIQNYQAALSILQNVFNRFPNTQGIEDQIEILRNVILLNKQKMKV
ncbi:tetratricopeptide repeat protein [Pseudoalteromonas aurantia]|uniref:Uncharacterized protein n=1 Tax=Pseudoalteromonas aurantia TaxID=43654 RepID=A0A5S3V7P8_9GAMM|nr:tetratricopeptide repeat protein [Pseudoalteromonas aurantia]TMO67802.1 hypothetical protein CWC19_11960 [Pseudoalteromonas aurantia]TMO78172.1 hypothetical protein CWC20_02065 [Pseudoalteromonas aurantia]